MTGWISSCHIATNIDSRTDFSRPAFPPTENYFSSIKTVFSCFTSV